MKLDREKRYAKNTLILFISKFFTQILSLLILPIITSALSKNEYGNFDLISTYAFLLVSFMTLKVENGMFRYFLDATNENENKKVFTSSIFLIAIQMSIFTLIYFVIGYIFKIKHLYYIFFYALSSLFFNIFLETVRGLKNNISYSIGSCIVGFSNLILCFVFVFKLEQGLFGMILSGIISHLLGGIYLIFNDKLFKYFNLSSFDKRISHDILKYSIPLVPNSLSSWILSISDKIMLSLMVSTGANGIYAIVTKFPTLLSHMYSVFNLSWTETASLSVNENDRDNFFSKMIDRIFQICFSLCVVTISFMPIIFKVLINQNFYDAYIYIPILIVAVIFEIYSGLLGAVYISFKNSKKIAISTFFAGIINVGINLMFMKKFGIYAACFSTLIAYMALSVYRFIDLKKYVSLNINYKKYLILFTILSVSIALYYSFNAIGYIFNMFFVTICCLIINREMIFSIGVLVKEKFKNRENKYEKV